LPDKALDLIDEAASRAKLRRAKEPQSLGDIAESLRKMIDSRGGKLPERADIKQRAAVTEESVAEVVSLSVGIPVTKLTQAEEEKLLSMENILERRVIGQKSAVKAVSDAVRRSRSGLRDPKRPCSFLFCGPSGSGKTELARALAECLFDDENALIKLDMSEYMEKHSVSKLIGSPPGYIGFEEGGQLTERVRRKPYGVILFDEIEKAHPDVFNILLQITEDGVLTDSNGRKVNFKNAIVIITSNIGADKLTPGKQLGFGDADTDYERKKTAVMSEIKKMFRIELLNRLDEIIIFDRLSDESMQKIARKLLRELGERAKSLGVSLEFSDEAVGKLTGGDNKTEGARKLRREITNGVENRLSRELIDGKVKRGDTAVLTVTEGEFSFKIGVVN
jgi:ATP-dependent Clp protease ATP-binding subunit ClpC